MTLSCVGINCKLIFCYSFRVIGYDGCCNGLLGKHSDEDRLIEPPALYTF